MTLNVRKWPGLLQFSCCCCCIVTRLLKIVVGFYEEVGDGDGGDVGGGEDDIHLGAIFINGVEMDVEPRI